VSDADQMADAVGSMYWSRNCSPNRRSSRNSPSVMLAPSGV
jgi:hypothetical protein